MGATIPPSTPISNMAKEFGLRSGAGFDNMPAFKKAAAALAGRQDKSIFLPPGNYYVVLDGTTVDWPAGTKLWALPGLGTKITVDVSTWSSTPGGTTRILFRYTSGSSFSGIEFDGQKDLVNSGNFTSYGLCFLNRSENYASDCDFIDLTFRNQLSGSLALECFCWASGYYSQRLRLVRCRTYDCNGTAYSFNGNMSYLGGPPYEVANPGTMVNDCDVIDSSAYRCKWQGLTCFGARNIRIINFVGDTCGSTGVFGGQAINLEWCDNISIVNPQCTNCYGPGIGGFAWLDRISIQLTGMDRISNNNQLDYNNLGEIAFTRGYWYTNGFPAYANGTGQWLNSSGVSNGGYYRQNLSGCLQRLTIAGPTGCITPKTTGTYKTHLHLESDFNVTYPTVATSQVQRVIINVPDVHNWSVSVKSTEIYADVNALQWMPNQAYTANQTRRNAGILWTCTTAGTSGTGVGPQGTVGDTGVTDGTAVWTATSLVAARIGACTEYARGEALVLNDIRVTRGYAYRVTVPSAFGFTGIAGTGNGPVGSVIGGTETDGTVTWTCAGPITSSGQMSKLIDHWPPGTRIEGYINQSGSACSPLQDWTATSMVKAIPLSGGSSGVALTASVAGTSSGNIRIADIKYLPQGSYIARIRYKNPSDYNWFFGVKLAGMFDSSTGFYQYATQLTALPNDTTTEYETEIAFTVPRISQGLPSVYYAGGTAGATLGEVSVKIIPLRKGQNRDEIWLGGKKSVPVSSNTPRDVDFEVGDRLLSSSSFASDLICTTAGTYGNINSATTLTFANGANTGTLSVIDSSFRAGMWLNVLGSGGTSYRKILYVSGTTITLNNGVTSDITAIAPLIVNPVFQNLQSSIATQAVNTNLTAKAGGGQTGATQIYYGYNHISTVATAADSVILPAAVAGREVRVVNAGGNSLAVFPATGEKVGNGASTANASTSIASQSHNIMTCFINGVWNAK